jgi:hypothetical protein
MYKGLFDENHFIAPLDLINFKRRKFLPNGFYDSNILCENCDNVILGNLESYANIVIWGSKGSRVCYPKFEKRINGLNQRFLHLTNLDYKKFKLFLLSIVWRASISHHKVFESVSLGEHEDIIRKMLFENNPKSTDNYPVGMFILSKTAKGPTKMIANPIPIKQENSLSYHFLINGLVINYRIEGQADKELYEQIAIKEDNTMDIYIFNEKETTEYLDSYLKKKLRYK